MARRFDLILLDWGLRDGTGVELCLALRNAGVTAPVLFYTGMNITNALLDEVSRIGAQDVLTKPGDFNDLLQKVTHYISEQEPDQ